MATLTVNLDDPTDVARGLVILRMLQQRAATSADDVASVLDRATPHARWLAKTVAEMTLAGETARGPKVRARHPENPPEGTLGAWSRSLSTAAKARNVALLMEPRYPDGGEVVYDMAEDVAQAVLEALERW
jgi:hypothetical protein